MMIGPGLVVALFLVMVAGAMAKTVLRACGTLAMFARYHPVSACFILASLFLSAGIVVRFYQHSR